MQIGDKWGYIDTTGHRPPSFYFAESFSEGLAKVQNEMYQTGYIDTRGTLVIDMIYEDARPVSEGLALVGVAQVTIPNRVSSTVKGRFCGGRLNRFIR